MTEFDDCIVCHNVDALGRHDPMCSRAVQLGLSRRAEGEEPVEGEPEPQPDQPAPDPPRQDSGAGAKMCVACLDYHIYPDDEPNCKKVGKSLVHPQCAWRMNYEGAEAWQVIDALEKLAAQDVDGNVSVESVRDVVQDRLRANA